MRISELVARREREDENLKVWLVKHIKSEYHVRYVEIATMMFVNRENPVLHVEFRVLKGEHKGYYYYEVPQDFEFFLRDN